MIGEVLMKLGIDECVARDPETGLVIVIVAVFGVAVMATIVLLRRINLYRSE